MLRRYLLLAAVAVSLLSWRAPLRQGEGGFNGNGLIKETLGDLGYAGRWIEGSLRYQLVGKRVHYMKGEHSWSGEVLNVKVHPFSAENNVKRKITVHVRTMISMGDNQNTIAYISLDQISGIMKEAHPLIGSSIRVSYNDRTIALPSTPAGMFLAGEANTIVAVYSDGYLEVDVTGAAIGTGTDEVAAGTVFIHMEDIIRDEKLQIVSKLDLE